MKTISITLNDNDEEILKRVSKILYGEPVGGHDAWERATVKTCLVRGAERIIEVMSAEDTSTPPVSGTAGH